MCQVSAHNGKLTKKWVFRIFLKIQFSIYFLCFGNNVDRSSRTMDKKYHMGHIKLDNGAITGQKLTFPHILQKVSKWRKFFFSFLAVTFFLVIAAQIRLDFANRKFNSASFASRIFFPGPILKELEGGYFRKSAVFSLFLKLQGAISSSKIDLETWFLHQNVGNLPLKTNK